MKRLLPDGLAGRFALLLAAALIAANLIALALLSFERARLGRAAVLERESERIVSLVPALEATPEGRREEVARKASTRFSRVSIGASPVVEAAATAPRSAMLTRRLAQALDARQVRAAVMVRPSGVGEAGAHDRRRREVVAISIRLDTAGPAAQWLNVVTRGGAGRHARGIEQEVFLIILAVSLVSVLGVGLLFIRRLTRPLSGLAAAARAAGQGDRTAQVPETGPREMREAAAAFNEMQGRIASFDAERMRTLAAVGHDLRTPITSLRIRAELLAEDEGAPMIRTLDEMTVMAAGLVAYARGAGDGEAPEQVDLAALLTRLCGELGAQMTEAGAGEVTGRPVALGRAFGNIIDNAIRYGAAANVRVVRDRQLMVVTVEDDGPGIAAERLDSITEPFVRGEDSRSAETGGAGLGLAIARNIIASHGGAMTLENRTDGGLCVTIRLPVAE